VYFETVAEKLKNRKWLNACQWGSTALPLHNTTVYRFCSLRFIEKQIHMQATADTRTQEMCVMQNDMKMLSFGNF
jgi:hypothetical protein